MIEPGQIVGAYSIGALLAEGAMARVFEARGAGGAPVVVKVLKPVPAPAGKDGIDTLGAKRFAREAHLGRVLSHGGLARMVDHGPDWIAFERLSVGLADATIRAVYAEPGRAAWLLAQLAQALAFLHSRGVVHRDVKPSHVLWRGEAVPVLVDLGIAGLTAEDPLEGAEIVGSPAWMAPEQAAGALPAPAADVWSLCALGHWLVTGKTLFTGSADAVLAARQAGSLPAFDGSGFPVGAAPLRALLEAGLATDPAQRPALRDFLESSRLP